MTLPSDARTLEALLRSDFRAFVHKAFTTLCPGQNYVNTWHLEAIAWQLERVRRGEIRRLIINMPPRSLKSIMASVAFPAFVLGHNPSRRIICVSYSGDLARKHSNDFRAVGLNRRGIEKHSLQRGSDPTRTQKLRSSCRVGTPPAKEALTMTGRSVRPGS
jgi:hypothetical protein